MTGAERVATAAPRRWPLWGLLLLSASALAQPDPRELLDRMSAAVRALDYEGRFVVQTGGQLHALHIVHRNDDGIERERVVSLTGKPREILRTGEAVACLTPGSRDHINVGRRAQGRSASPLQAVSTPQLKRYYHLELGESARVAGRDAYQLSIEPKDDLRFGYLLFIDKQWALPLRSIMLDAAREPISQLMFVDLRVEERIPHIEQQAPGAESPPAALDVVRERLTPPAWTFDQTPPGFQLSAHRRAHSGDATEAREHFIFSDGLATVSVYVQPKAAGVGLDGESRFGSSSAVGTVVDGHEVIAVGEVPVKTLRLFTEQLVAVRR
jgi:sigma-E factor negative regulatory protein RseB